MKDKDFNPEKITLPPELEERLFFTPKEFGAMFGVCRGTVYRWAQEGYIKLTRYSPRCLMVSRSEVERCMLGKMMESQEE